MNIGIKVIIKVLTPKNTSLLFFFLVTINPIGASKNIAVIPILNDL